MNKFINNFSKIIRKLTLSIKKLIESNLSRFNNFSKIIIKLTLSINKLIESNLSKLSIKNLKKNQIKLSKNSKFFFSFLIIITISLTYLSIPVFYDKAKIKLDLERHLFETHGVKFYLSDNVQYRLYPKPHFLFENSNIINKKKNLADIENFKIFISLKNLLQPKKIQIKDIILENTNFNLDNESFNFFTKLINNDPVENKIFIKKSNIFFKNHDEEVLFINKILEANIFYDYKKKLNTLIFNNEIFNIPYLLKFQNNQIDKKLFTQLNSRKVRIKVINEINYNSEKNLGLLNLSIANKKILFDYELNKNLLSFFSTLNNSNKDTFSKGEINFEPFYFLLGINLDKLNISDLFNERSLLLELLNSEILNNNNLNMNVTLKSNNLNPFSQLNNLFLKANIDNGEIDLKGSQVQWKDKALLKISYNSFYSTDNSIGLNGKITVDIVDIKKFYNYFQTPKNLRLDIKKVEFNFSYDLLQKKIIFDNLTIDEKYISKVDNILNNFNTNKKSFNNRIDFKNFVNKLFRVYSG